MEHPLKTWLGRNGRKAWKFADENGIARRSVYALINGENLNPSSEALKKIEDATEGEISGQMLLDWTREKILKGRRHARQHART